MPAARDTAVGAPARTWRLGARVKHVEDTPPAPRLHTRKSQAGQPDDGEQLEVQIGLPDRVCDLFECARLRLPSVVDQDVELAEFADHGGEHAFYLPGLAYVAGEGGDVGLGLAGDLGSGLVEDIGAPGGDCDLGTGFGKFARHGAPESPAAACNQGDPPIHAYIHLGASWLSDRLCFKPYHGRRFFWKKSRYPRISLGSFYP